MRFMLRSLEQTGVSAISFRPATGDALFSNPSTLTPPCDHDLLCTAIEAAVRGRISPSFMIFASIRAANTANGSIDATRAASAYTEAGADGIVVVEDYQNDPQALFNLCRYYRRREPHGAIFVALAAGNTCYESAFHAAGVNALIYGDQMLRAAFSAMKRAAASIIERERAFESDAQCATTQEITNAIRTSQDEEPL